LVLPVGLVAVGCQFKEDYSMQYSLRVSQFLSAARRRWPAAVRIFSAAVSGIKAGGYELKVSYNRNNQPQEFFSQEFTLTD